MPPVDVEKYTEALYGARELLRKQIDSTNWNP
jgi:hypothetical protein